MKYIDATEKEIIRRRVTNIPALEITSFEQLAELPLGTEVAIMNNCDMVIGKINDKINDLIFIDDYQGIISVRSNSFKYGNFMYQLL